MLALAVCFMLLPPAIEADDATVRQRFAASLADATNAASLTALWLLAYDAEPDVRASALQAVQQRCSHESSSVCVSMLGFFANDTLIDIAWTARDAMLQRDVAQALTDASVAYKLDLLARLGGAIELSAQARGIVLRLLTQDADGQVSQNASWLLEHAP